MLGIHTRGRLPWLLGAALICLIATTWPFGRDPDVWWHLAMGRYILDHGIPATEPFAYASAQYPWIGQQWLYEIFLALVTPGSAGGIAVVVMALVSVAALLVSTARIPGSVPAPLVSASVVVCAFVAAQELGVRGQVVTVLGVALTLWILDRWRRGDSGIVWYLPLLLAVWCNLHAGFITAFFLMALFLVVPQRSGFGVAGNRRALLAAGVVSLVATFINPAGPRIYPYVTETFTNPILTSWISEWQSPNFHEPLIQLFALTAMILIFLWAVSRDVEYVDVVLGLLAISATVLAQRNLSLFSVIACPQLAIYGHRALQRVEVAPLHRAGLALIKPLRAHATTTSVVLLLCVALFVLPIVIYTVQVSENGSYELTHEPQQAATYYSQNYFGDRIYSWYDNGGYLVYRFPAGRVVYIYGESAVFGPQALTQYLQIHDLQPGWQQVVATLNAKHAILPAGAAEGQALKGLGWRVDCSDSAGFVLMSAPGVPEGIPVSDAPGEC